MGRCATRVCTCTSVGVAAVAVALGLCASGIPRQLGFFTWIASQVPQLSGMSPAFTEGIEPRFDFLKLSEIDLSGQTAVVTGANSGLGFATSLHLARQGASVVMACRTASKCESAAASIRANTSRGAVQTLPLDTASLASVRDFADRLLEKNVTIEMLYLNAGVGGTAEKLSVDGVELVFATNVLGHHLLYTRLKVLLERASRSRVVLTSSAANFATYEYGVADTLATLNAGERALTYGHSKFAQILWAQEATRQLLPDSTVQINAAHPGAVDTGIWEAVMLLGPTFGPPVRWFVQVLQQQFMWSAEDGALTMLYALALSNAHGSI